MRKKEICNTYVLHDNDLIYTSQVLYLVCDENASFIPEVTYV